MNSLPKRTAALRDTYRGLRPVIANRRRILLGTWLLLAVMTCIGLGPPAVAFGQTTRRHSIMHPTPDKLHEWNEAYKNAPPTYLNPALKAASLRRGSFSVMSYSPWNASNLAQREQNICGDCWVWAGTGLAEIALRVNNNVTQRLSVQLFNSCWTDSGSVAACCGGFLHQFAAFYNTTNKYMVAWETANGWFLDGTINENGDCGKTNATCASIGSSPQYTVDAATISKVPTNESGTTQSQAIANMKNVLNQNKAIDYTMSLPTGTDWDAFYNFWYDQEEGIVFDPSQYSGQTWDSSTGGAHDEMIVGYNDDDPNNSYWIVQNSWGTSTNRPNGVWYLNMNTNYAGYYVDTDSAQQPLQQFSTLDITFSLPTATGTLQVAIEPAGAVTAGAQWQVDGGSWQQSGASIADLSVGTHTVTYMPITGFTAPASQTVTVAQGATQTAKGAYAPETDGSVNLLSTGIPASVGVNAFNNGFEDRFATSLGNWTANSFGTWTVANGMASVTGTSSGNFFNLTYSQGTFSNFDYSVSMRRSNDDFDDANALYFRGVSDPQSSTGRWNAGYRFAFANNRKYQISYCLSGDTWTTLVDWTESTAIVPLDWNVLRVVASGSSLEFFINGTSVYTTTNTQFASGQVGIEMYDNSGGTLDVNKALLSTVIP